MIAAVTGNKVTMSSTEELTQQVIHDLSLEAAKVSLTHSGFVEADSVKVVAELLSRYVAAHEFMVQKGLNSLEQRHAERMRRSTQ